MTISHDAGILVLPGGKPRSDDPSHAWQLANLRMALVAGSLRRAAVGRRITVRRVQYRLRGWNAGRLDALGDARQALDAMLDAVGSGPVVVVGHSMGGRVAAHLAGDGRVAGVVALAPWWPDQDADLIPPGCGLLTMHGSADTWTSPVAARAQTARALSRGVDASFVDVPGAGHFMLRDYFGWHRRTGEFAIARCSQRRRA